MIGSIPSPLNALNQATQSLTTSLHRLSSGSLINSAQDDPAGLAIATQMAAQLGSDNQALRNVSDGFSIAETAGGELVQLSDSLQRMRELAVQAANGTNSASDRQAIQAEFSQFGQGIDQLSAQTQFNGQNLLDGSFNVSIQTGPNAGDTQSLALGDFSANGLGIAAIDVSSAQGASNALDTIDQAISNVNSQQGLLGAAQASLNSTAAALTGTYENLAASRSRIADTDYAAESTNLSQAALRQKVALKAVSLYNANQASILDLLPPQKG